MSTMIATAALADFPAHLAASEIRLKRILVVIDFSSQSRRALAEATAIADRFGSELLLVDSTSDPAADAANLRAISDGRTARGRMATLIATAPELEAIPHRQLLFDGTSCSEPLHDRAAFIQQIARRNHVDLVIAVSHGAAGLESLALGSAGMGSMLSMVPCPVLIVGPHCRERGGLQSILLATDLETTGARSAELASLLAQEFSARLTLLHVVEKRSRRFHVQPELEEDNARQVLSEVLPRTWERYPAVRLWVEQGKAGETISNVARSVDAGLIVLGFGVRSSLGDRAPWSTTSTVIREAVCPVLCVRRHFA